MPMTLILYAPQCTLICGFITGSQSGTGGHVTGMSSAC